MAADAPGSAADDVLNAGANDRDGSEFLNASTSGLEPASASAKNGEATYCTRELLYTAATLARRKQMEEEETGKSVGAEMAWIDAGRLVKALYAEESRDWDSATFEMKRTGWEILAEEFERDRFKCSLRSSRYGTAHRCTHTLSRVLLLCARVVLFFLRREIRQQRDIY